MTAPRFRSPRLQVCKRHPDVHQGRCAECQRDKRQKASGQQISGVYALWSPDCRTVYVGESDDIYTRRDSYDVARRLGCKWKLIRRLKSSATKADRIRAEAEVARYLS